MDSPMETTKEPTFALFPRLPSELRVLIWDEAIRSSLTPRPPTIRQLSYRPYMATDKPPTLLHVNSEARYEAFKYYTQRTITFTNKRPMLLFFGPGVETLFLDTQPSSSPSLESKNPFLRCYCADARVPCRCSALNYNSPLTHGCPCPHSELLENRQRHLLHHFARADTSSIPHIALHMHGKEEPSWIGFVRRYIRMTFRQVKSVTFVANPPKDRARIMDFASSGSWEDAPTWHFYRKSFALQDLGKTEFKLWVKDDVSGCWWRLVDGRVEYWTHGLGFMLQVICYDREKRRMRRGTSLEDLVNGGLE